ncbi:hypothetical protein RP20_CCG006557 [Aedes albopictus]|nr:hypothetical protein RP20_CCG006557 [Aedes albopictus]
MSSSESALSSKSSESAVIGEATDDGNFTHVEYLDDNFPSFEESHDPLDEGRSPEPCPERTGKGKPKPKSQINITINQSGNEFRNAQYHFTGLVFVRCFKTQHLSDAVGTVDIFGESVDDVVKCLWQSVQHHVSREVIVEQNDEEKLVKWSPKESPDVSDLDKFVFLKHGKTKKIYTMEDIQENTKLLTGWREKEIQIHVFKYAMSITSLSLWEVVNKQLLHPGKKDRAGAPSTEELFDCVNKLKDIHAHYTALRASWEKWANYILAQPGDQREKLMYEAPPDDYLHLFRAPPVSEGSQLQLTRQGLKIAYNMNDRLFEVMNNLCKKVDSMAKLTTKLQIEIHEVKAEISNSRSLLDVMATSLPPEETEFSRKLISRVTDLEDFDHQDN